MQVNQIYTNFQACQKQLSGIEAIDYFLARKLCGHIKHNLHNETLDLFFHSILAISQSLRQGHTCLKLDDYANTLCWSNEEETQSGFQFPDLSIWLDYLSYFTISNNDNSSIVLEFDRLYLRRYWLFEKEIALSFKHYAQSEFDISSDLDRMKKVIADLFPNELFPNELFHNEEQQTKQLDLNFDQTIDWQMLAVVNALIQPLSIIAGGPGTGKTFTVTKVLAAMQAINDSQLSIALVAPTGKAAQRLTESISKAKRYLSQTIEDNSIIDSTIIDSIPDQASTLHRLLGVKKGRHDFRYNESNQLPYDVVLVDEVSMIDLPLMCRLLRAIASHTRLIFLGDADQLPSVAAGSILSDLTLNKDVCYSTVHLTKLKQLTTNSLPNDLANDNGIVRNYLTVLQKSHRFEGGGEIGILAKQVIDGQVSESWQLLQQANQQVSLNHPEQFITWLEKLTLDYYVPVFDHLKQQSLPTDKLITELFSHFNQFRFLSATRLGPVGVLAINQLVEAYLRRKGLIKSSSDFYPGRPILITENHYSLGLYNGDIGFICPDENNQLKAVFPSQHNTDENEPGYRWFSLARLPAIETVYCMTIHKTQGSEFSTVALILPENDSPILSRELLYTGITRAAEQLSIITHANIWKTCVERKVQRHSGLSLRVFNEELL